MIKNKYEIMNYISFSINILFDLFLKLWLVILCVGVLEFHLIIKL